MLIQYTHISEPEKTKIHDTEKVRKNTFFAKKTQKEVDAHEIACFRRDKAKGLIIDYKILGDEKI